MQPANKGQGKGKLSSNVKGPSVEHTCNYCSFIVVPLAAMLFSYPKVT
jgi:hypothetical protein